MIYTIQLPAKQKTEMSTEIDINPQKQLFRTMSREDYWQKTEEPPFVRLDIDKLIDKVDELEKRIKELEKAN